MRNDFRALFWIARVSSDNDDLHRYNVEQKNYTEKINQTKVIFQNSLENKNIKQKQKIIWNAVI